MYVCVADFVYLSVCWVTLENRPVECRDSSVCLSLLGCFPRTQEALDITLAGKKKITTANHSRKMLGLQQRTKGRDRRQKGQKRDGRMREEKVEESGKRA